MFDELMGKSNEMQAQMQQELAAIKIAIDKQGVSLQGDATGAISEVTLSEDLLSPDNKEMIEDLLLLSIQEFNAKANKASDEVSQKTLGNLFSGGGLGNLFG